MNGPKSIVDQYYFGWMDGKLWQKFLEQFEIKSENLPQILVLDVPTKTYWLSDEHKSVKDLLEAIDNGIVESKLVQPSNKGFMAKVRKAEFLFFEYLPWSLIGLILFCATLVWFITPVPEEMRSAYRKEIREEKSSEAKTPPGDAGGKESKKTK
jgi:hypothetical protein